MILTVNSYYLTKQHQPAGLCNEYECTYARCEGANRNFKQYLHNSQVSKCQDQSLIKATSTTVREEVMRMNIYKKFMSSNRVPVTVPVVAQRVGRVIALLFHDHGTRRG